MVKVGHEFLLRWLVDVYFLTQVVVIKIYFKIGDTPKEGVEGERWTGNLGLVEVNYYI